MLRSHTSVSIGSTFADLTNQGSKLFSKNYTSAEHVQTFPLSLFLKHDIVMIYIILHCTVCSNYFRDDLKSMKAYLLRKGSA